MAEEIKNQGQQENAENLNENVSGQAKEIISAALEETQNLSLIHISEPTRRGQVSRMPSSA